MGVLEDAIRDHLDLKRRHGASDEEVEQEEAEALGPARRGFDRPADEPAGELEIEDEEEGPPHDQSTQVHEQPLEEEGPAEPEAEAEPEPEPHREGDALFEGLPDFLQETPEDDQQRLERKPPRDFDFE